MEKNKNQSSFPQQYVILYKLLTNSFLTPSPPLMTKENISKVKAPSLRLIPSLAVVVVSRPMLNVLDRLVQFQLHK